MCQAPPLPKNDGLGYGGSPSFFWGAFRKALFDTDLFQRLHLRVVHRVELVFHGAEINLFQADAAYVPVVGGVVIYLAVRQVDGRCPLGGARDVGSLSLRMLDTDGHIEIVSRWKHCITVSVAVALCGAVAR